MKVKAYVGDKVAAATSQTSTLKDVDDIVPESGILTFAPEFAETQKTYIMTFIPLS